MSAHSVECTCRRATLTIFLLDDDDVDGTAERGRIDGVPGIRNCAAKIAHVVHAGKRPRVREGVQQDVSENRAVSGGRGMNRSVEREAEEGDGGLKDEKKKSRR